MLECPLEGLHLLVPAHEAGEPARARHVQARAHLADALQLENVDGRPYALDLELAEIAELEET